MGVASAIAAILAIIGVGLAILGHGAVQLIGVVAVVLGVHAFWMIMRRAD